MATVPVVLVPYDPDWPRQFELESALLSRLFTGTAFSIEHVGSTAVPGLAAKPVIDVMVGVSALSEVESRIPELERHGYEHVREYEAQIPERRYLRKPRAGPRTHHLHAVVRGSRFWCRHLLFRDYLRGHPEAASAYLELKQQLALRHRTLIPPPTARARAHSSKLSWRRPSWQEVRPNKPLQPTSSGHAPREGGSMGCRRSRLDTKPPTRGRAPPGSITVASPPLDDSDETAKGFYLRRVDSVLWLRGYWSWPGHIWSPDDLLVFSRAA